MDIVKLYCIGQEMHILKLVIMILTIQWTYVSISISNIHIYINILAILTYQISQIYDFYGWDFI